MSTSRRCVSLTPELDGALMGLAASRGESVSALVETLLREHSLVREEILLARMEEKLPDILAVPGRNSRLRKALKVASKRPSP